MKKQKQQSQEVRQMNRVDTTAADHLVSYRDAGGYRVSCHCSCGHVAVGLSIGHAAEKSIRAHVRKGVEIKAR